MDDRTFIVPLMLCVVMTVGLFGCNLSVNNGKRIVRIAIAQSETHPEYLGLVAFKEYVEERLGDKYEVQIFPNELLGSIQKTIESIVLRQWMRDFTVPQLSYLYLHHICIVITLSLTVAFLTLPAFL